MLVLFPSFQVLALASTSQGMLILAIADILDFFFSLKGMPLLFAIQLDSGISTEPNVFYHIKEILVYSYIINCFIRSKFESFNTVTDLNMSTIDTFSSREVVSLPLVLSLGGPGLH